jgi:outer membrane protein OmpA-like peptidoglycan-associated protein
MPNLYGIASLGATSVDDYPAIPRTARDSTLKGFSLTRYGGGLGYLWPFNFGRYEFAVRSEALYVGNRRDADVRPGGDIGAPRIFNEAVVNIGLQLPLQFAAPPTPVSTPEPVQVVSVTDSDRDGVLDDVDQCPNTPFGEPVDAVGCPLLPPPPACGDAVSGSVTSIEGCGVGDSIVLRGVNFDTNKAALTVNAKTLLDDVAEDLKRFPDVTVEVSGHTDSRGASEYNQQLSERRAETAVNYLVEAGVSRDRLAAEGYGEDRPVADNETAEGQDRNRRVELRVTGGSTVQSTRSATPASTPSPTLETPAALDLDDDAADGTDAVDESDVEELTSSPTATPAPTSAPAPTADGDTDAALDELFDF